MNNKKKTRFGLIFFSVLLLGILIPPLFNSVLVSAQSGYIEYYVYDAYTLNPIVGAEVLLFDENGWILIDSGFTDSNGFCNLTGLDAAIYYTGTVPSGYQGNDTYVTIDYDGEGELVIFYMEPVGSGFIDVYVYDYITSEPISGTLVELYIYDYGSWHWMTSQYTDSYGFCNFTGLKPKNYYVDYKAPGYQLDTDSVTIDYPGEGEYLECYLDPLYIPGDSFIEVYVYDNKTYVPVQGAEITLLDENKNILTNGLTDIDGFYNFTGLGAGIFWVVVGSVSYEVEEEYIAIDYDGQGIRLDIYFEPIFVPGNGFIEVYVYGADTLAPISWAWVDLFSSGYYTLDYGMTDANGFFNFTGLGEDLYIIWGSKSDYVLQEESVVIDYDGEGESLYLFLPPVYVPGNGFIDVYVYNNDTLNPVVGAEVRLYDEYDVFIDNGYTDSNGFYNFTGLGVSNHRIVANALGYVENSSYVLIDYDGEGEYLELYLPPIVHIFDILSPSDSQTVEGGLVFLNCYADDASNLDYIDVYVNAQLITSFDVYNQGFHDEFFVPIFENGTNTIYIEAHWLDMSSASDTVDINSINVIPCVKIKEGDILNYLHESLTTTQKANYNFTFVEWLSPFEMNTSIIVHVYDHTGTLLNLDYYIVVNVLNGYVSVDSNMLFLNNRFFPFSGLVPNPLMGDQFAMVYWFEILTLTGSGLWEYTDVWILDYMEFSSALYVEKSSNLVYYFEIPDQVEVNLIETTIDFLAPYVIDVSDFGYIEGYTGYNISWSATDMNPLNYTVYRDSVIIVDSATWEPEVPIVIDVDGLAVGTYTFKIVVQDLAGNIAEETVIVTVDPTVPELNSVLRILFLPAIICMTLVFVLKKRKFQVIK